MFFDESKKAKSKKSEPQNQAEGVPMSETADTTSDEFLKESESLELPEAPPANYLSTDTPVDLDAMFDSLSNTPTNRLNEATANYLSLDGMKVGEERDFVVLSKTTYIAQKTGEVLPAFKLIDASRMSWICAAKVLVDNLAKLENIPCAIRLKYNGKKKGGEGNYHNVQIFTA